MTLAPAPLIEPPNGLYWKTQLWQRFCPPNYSPQLVVELDDARSRQLHLDLYAPSTFNFVIDGRSQSAVDLIDMAQDVVVYHWDSVAGVYRVVFRGPVGIAEDTISEQSHTIALQCSDYRAMMNRRNIPGAGNIGPPGGGPPTGPISGTAHLTDQADMAHHIMELANGQSGTTSGFGGVYDLGQRWGGVRNPDGSYLGASTTVYRLRTVYGAEKLADWIDNLAICQGGFDWQVYPVDPAADTSHSCDVWLYYPQKGVTRSLVLEWGVTVASLTRTFNTSTFSNYVWVTGASLLPLNIADQPQTTSPVMVAAALGTANVGPEGYWMEAIAYPDVQQTATLNEYASGQLAFDSNPQPSYSLVMESGVWHSPSDFDLGDSLELRIDSGRLHVDDTVRVVAFDFAIDDDGADVLTLTVARPSNDFADEWQGHGAALDALSRR